MGVPPLSYEPMNDVTFTIFFCLPFSMFGMNAWIIRMGPSVFTSKSLRAASKSILS